MQSRLFHCALAIATLVLSARAAQAQTVAVGPYYATPSWDQTIACGTPATCPRFIVLSNMNSDAVLDRETGLVWERSPSQALMTIQLPTNQFGGATAFERCIGLNVGNRMGWRVPTMQELVSLIDKTQRGPALPPGHPFLSIVTTDSFGVEDPFTGYWSSTEYRNSFGTAFRYVAFDLGLTGAGSISQRVWCVRGGSGTPIQ